MWQYTNAKIAWETNYFLMTEEDLVAYAKSATKTSTVIQIVKDTAWDQSLYQETTIQTTALYRGMSWNCLL